MARWSSRAGVVALLCALAGLAFPVVAVAVEVCPSPPAGYTPGADVVADEVHGLRGDLVQQCRALDDLTELQAAIDGLADARPTVEALEGVRGAVEALRGDLAGDMRTQRELLERIAVATEALDAGGSASVVRLDGVDAGAVGDAARSAAETLNENFWYLAGLLCGLFAGAQMLRRMLP